MTKVDLHRTHVTRIRRRAQMLGKRTQAGPKGIDLIVDGLRLAVLVARPHARLYRVKAKGRNYQYVYDVWQWNLHRHGRTRLEPPDVWVVVAAGHNGATRATYLVPRDRVRAQKTLSVLAKSLHHGVGHQLAPWREAWSVLENGGA